MNKGLIFDIRRFSVHDGPGIRTTVFFKGCPLSCWWCHNPESQENSIEEISKILTLDGKKYSRTGMSGKYVTTDEVMEEVSRDRLFYVESCGGVTFSGGEPLMQPEFLFSLLESCKKQGIHTAVDTCGLADNKVFRDILPLTDLFLYDLKIIDEDLHREYTGGSNTGIIANLDYIARQGKKIIIRFPVIPGITDTRKNIDSIKELLVNLFLSEPNIENNHHSEGGINISLLPYHSMSGSKYERLGRINRMKDIQDVKKEELSRLKKELEETGMLVNIGS